MRPAARRTAAERSALDPATTARDGAACVRQDDIIVIIITRIISGIRVVGIVIGSNSSRGSSSSSSCCRCSRAASIGARAVVVAGTGAALPATRPSLPQALSVRCVPVQCAVVATAVGRTYNSSGG